MAWRSTWLGVATGVVLVLVGFVYWSNHSPGNDAADRSDLPEWFGRAYRIRHVTAATPAVHVEGIGMLLPGEKAPLPAGFTASWFEENFTHYLKDDAFVWDTARVVYPSDGKILTGARVILGQETGTLSLVCACRKDGRPLNMYIESAFLRPRSKGPPTPSDD